MKYSEEIKTDVASQFKSGSKATEICTKYGISTSSFSIQEDEKEVIAQILRDGLIAGHSLYSITTRHSLLVWVSSLHNLFSVMQMS